LRIKGVIKYLEVADAVVIHQPHQFGEGTVGAPGAELLAKDVVAVDAAGRTPPRREDGAVPTWGQPAHTLLFLVPIKVDEVPRWEGEVIQILDGVARGGQDDLLPIPIPDPREVHRTPGAEALQQVGEDRLPLSHDQIVDILVGQHLVGKVGGVRSPRHHMDALVCLLDGPGQRSLLLRLLGQ